MRRQGLALGAVLTLSLMCWGFNACPVGAAAGALSAHAVAAAHDGSIHGAVATPIQKAGSRSDGGRTAGQLSVAPYSLPDSSGPVSFDGGSILMLSAKFAIVLILLFACLRVLKLVMPGGRQPGPGKARPMVLHTESLGDKHRVCLLDLGESIVVVGVSASGVSPITTIADQDEVERLRARYAHKRTLPMLPDIAIGAEQQPTGAEQPAFSAAPPSSSDELPSFITELSEAQSADGGDSLVQQVVRRVVRPAGGPARTRVQPRPVLHLQDSIRRRFAASTEPANDLDLDGAVGRLRDLRKRVERA